ncbi:uncharacterized protein LOC135389518 [Ornithodoros turicata]|uniref:uncharacterized protein LOC135389518 n=1 Tax=Ornithodoros turicata TaxID=34597 RepID=UPI003138EF7A
MANLEHLKKLRTSARSSVTRTITELKTTTPLPRDQLRDKLGFLDEKFSALSQQDQVIQNLITDELVESECEACDRYLESVIAIRFQVRAALGTLTSAQVSPATGDAPSLPTVQRLASPADGITLPKLKIDTFNGDLSKWQGFWDQFRATVHDNQRLTDVNRLKYLVSLVIGPAARAIEGLTILDGNYATAVEILKKRFGKSELLVTEHMGSLFDLKPVTSISDVKGLRELHETVTVRIRNLKSLGVAQSQYAIAVREAVLRKIPKELELEYYKQKDEQSTVDTLTSLLDFLETEIECRERVRRSAEDVPLPKRRAPLTPSASSLTANATDSSCILCKSSQHLLESCDRGLSPDEIRNTLRREGCCFLCGKKGHRSKDCRVCWKLRCGRCHRRHLTQLCLGSSRTEQPAASNPSSALASTTSTEDVVTSLSSSTKFSSPRAEVLLQTAKVWLEGSNGRRILARIILDGGSQRSFIRQEVSTKIGCFYGQFSSSSIVIEAVEYDDICSDSLPSLNSTAAQHVKSVGLQLADEPSAPTEISLLLGSDFYWKAVTGVTVRLSEYLVAAETLFGWTVQGASRDGSIRSRNVEVMRVGVLSEDTASIDSHLQAFWELEHLGITDPYPSELDTDSVLQDFRATTKLVDGRYVVRLPWKSERQPALGDNKALAVQRLEATTSKLRRDCSSTDGTV